MIEIFKTNVRTHSEAKKVLSSLKDVLSAVQANFDLQDCDKILRVQFVETADLPVVKIVLTKLGFNCEILN